MSKKRSFRRSSDRKGWDDFILARAADLDVVSNGCMLPDKTHSVGPLESGANKLPRRGRFSPVVVALDSCVIDFSNMSTREVAYRKRLIRSRDRIWSLSVFGPWAKSLECHHDWDSVDNILYMLSHDEHRDVHRVLRGMKK